MTIDDYKKYVIPFIKTIGYKIHPHIHINMKVDYLYNDYKGYINISYREGIYGNCIHFQRCFFEDLNYKDIINKYFYDFDEFYEFVKKYHIKEIRKIKIKKIKIIND